MNNPIKNWWLYVYVCLFFIWFGMFFGLLFVECGDWFCGLCNLLVFDQNPIYTYKYLSLQWQQMHSPTPN